MKEYLFVLEFDGRNTVENTLESSKVLIKAASIRGAIHTLCEQEKLKFTGINNIFNTNSYRVFLLKENIIGGWEPYIYLVKEGENIDVIDLHLEYN